MEIRDLDRIDAFIARADALGRTRLVRDGCDTGLTLSWDERSPLRTESVEPDQDDLQALMVQLRPFFLKDDPVYLERTLRLAIRLMRHDEFRSYLENVRQQWRHAAASGPMQLEVNGRDVGARELAELWMNGFYFHTNLEIQSFLSRLWPQAIIRQRFVWFLFDAVGVVRYTGNLLAIARRENLLRAA